jgi:glycosyltransferase involved in cell wall biosynthesis/phospholipid N-methyltransferase
LVTGNPRVSILIPVYNEAEYLPALMTRLLEVPLWNEVPIEIVAVDDGSTDGSAEALEELARLHRDVIRVVRHDRNRGKGAAIRTAIDHAAGEFAAIQDSDLEYNPLDLARLLAPLLEGHADAVFGSRFASFGERRVMYFWHSVANHFLTTVGNAVADLNLTDMETGYKAFRLSLVRSMPLRSNGFGFDPEITVKLAQRGVALYEVPISYRGRTYEEGKKIGFWDAAGALCAVLWYGLRRDIYRDRGARMLDTLSQTPRFNRWMADTIRPWVGARVIEIGAGMGNLTQHLAPRREVYIASDIDTEHLARLRVRFQHRPNVKVQCCDLSAAADFVPLAGRADTVICLNVLEHIEDDAAGLANIASALAAGGTAIVLVPQDQALYGTLDEVLGHVRRYSEGELRAKMEAAGLSVERMVDFNRITRPGWWLTGRVFQGRQTSRTALRILDRLVWVWRRIDRALPWRAVSVIGIARKRGSGL